METLKLVTSSVYLEVHIGKSLKSLILTKHHIVFDKHQVHSVEKMQHCSWTYFPLNADLVEGLDTVCFHNKS